jgi:hypothetical protein
MTRNPPQSRRVAAVHFGLGLGVLMIVTAVLSRPTGEALAIGQNLGLSSLGTHAALTLAMAMLTFAMAAAARAILLRFKGFLPQLGYALVGLPIGLVFAFGFDAFAGTGGLAAHADLYESLVLGLGFLFIAIGAFALLGTALSQFGGQDVGMSRRDRVMMAPASGVWILEGAALVLLTVLHVRGGGAEPFNLILLGLLCGCVLGDVALHALTWRAMDEFMRRAWSEAMALGLTMALAVGFVYSGAQSIGLVPSATVYHALTAFYGLYLVSSILHSVVRTPDIYSTPAEERAA